MAFAPPAASQTCTTTLASGSFLANGSWSASPIFNASSTGTVTLTVTGGASGQSSMTIDGGGSVSVANPGTGSQSVAAGTHSVVAGDGGVTPHAAGSYAIVFTGTSCPVLTTLPSAPAQHAQNQDTAIVTGQSVVGQVLGSVLFQAALLSYGIPLKDAGILKAMMAMPGLKKALETDLGFANIDEKTILTFAYFALDRFRKDRAGKDDPTFEDIRQGRFEQAAIRVWRFFGVYVSNIASSWNNGPSLHDVANLEAEDREQTYFLGEPQERRDGGFGGSRIAEPGAQFGGTQDRLRFARLNGRIALQAAEDGAKGAAPVEVSSATASRSHAALPGTAAGAPKSLSLNTRNLSAACLPGSDACEPFSTTRWNIWLEGRAMGSSDSLLQNNALGFLGFGGVSYQATPWLMTGLSVGTETFRTAWTSGAGSTTLGLSVVPYVGIRLDQNVQAAAFVGFTNIAYNTNPAPGVAAQFTAQRYMAGGALTGTWLAGLWRFEPSLQATYATENQNAYTDSAGTYVSGQQVFYGRIGAGPEIGYTFVGNAGAWMLEPFVSARINLNIASDTLAVVNNAPVVVRPGTLGSGSLGGGINLSVPGGASLRFQGSYDSIGVTGLDVWSALLRGSFAF